MTTDTLDPIPFGSDEWRAMMRRFWTANPQQAECDHCGKTFALPTRTTATVQRYCGPRCRSNAGSHRYNAKQRAGRREAA